MQCCSVARLTFETLANKEGAVMEKSERTGKVKSGQIDHATPNVSRSAATYGDGAALDSVHYLGS
jgi:hypothetical protein